MYLFLIHLFPFFFSFFYSLLAFSHTSLLLIFKPHTCPYLSLSPSFPSPSLPSVTLFLLIPLRTFVFFLPVQPRRTTCPHTALPSFGLETQPTAVHLHCRESSSRWYSPSPCQTLLHVAVASPPTGASLWTGFAELRDLQ